MMSPGSVLSDIEPVPFDKDNTVQPQLELMTISVQKSKPSHSLSFSLPNGRHQFFDMKNFTAKSHKCNSPSC